MRDISSLPGGLTAQLGGTTRWLRSVPFLNSNSCVSGGPRGRGSSCKSSLLTWWRCLVRQPATSFSGRIGECYVLCRNVLAGWP